MAKTGRWIKKSTNTLSYLCLTKSNVYVMGTLPEAVVAENTPDFLRHGLDWSAADQKLRSRNDDFIARLQAAFHFIGIADRAA